MQNTKMWLIGGGTVLAIAALVAWGVYEGKKEKAAEAVPDANVIYYYGAECPHCKKINEFIEEHNIASKLEFTKKEVWHNKKNSAEMQKRAESCGIAADKIGVPFIYQAAENTCLIGEPEARKFFAEKAGLNEDGSPKTE